MNLTSMYGPRKPHPPCKLFSEMAEEFGMSQQRLMQHMLRSSAPFPRPTLVDKKANHVWYNPAEVRAWWAARQKELHEAALSKL